MLNDVMKGMQDEKNNIQSLQTLSSQFHESTTESYSDLLEMIKAIQNTKTTISEDFRNKKIQREIRSLGSEYTKVVNRIYNLLRTYKLLD